MHVVCMECRYLHTLTRYEYYKRKGNELSTRAFLAQRKCLITFSLFQFQNLLLIKLAEAFTWKIDVTHPSASKVNPYANKMQLAKRLTRL